MKLVLIGNGAIARYVKEKLGERGHEIAACLLRPERVAQMAAAEKAASAAIGSVSEIPDGVTGVIDCAGHSGLRTYGPDILRAGYGLTTVSIGALADQALHDGLLAAAREGRTRIHLASGAIGALDCLAAASVGNLECVRYVGRKPPKGWMGSPAEDRLDLETLTGPAQTHFVGSARTAATEYPKNANVAAAVAVAGIGFDRTEVELVADPALSSNIHEVIARGDFGDFHFRISGDPLPDNPRSSALAAMSVVDVIDRQMSNIGF